MKIEELLDLLKTYPNYENMPKFVKADNLSDTQIYIDQTWQNVPYAWGIAELSDQWVFFLTDEERGYLTAINSFESENEVCEYAEKRLLTLAKGLTPFTPIDSIITFLQNRYDYSEEKAENVAYYIASEPDIFEEFYNNARVGRFEDKKGNRVEISGYTAEKLCRDFELNSAQAYYFLTLLRREPEQAREILENPE